MKKHMRFRCVNVHCHQPITASSLEGSNHTNHESGKQAVSFIYRKLFLIFMQIFPIYAKYKKYLNFCSRILVFLCHFCRNHVKKQLRNSRIN